MPAVPPPVPFVPAKAQKHINRAVILWGALASVVGGVASFLVTSASLSMKLDSFATDLEVETAIEKHNEQPRAHGTDWSRSPHPDYAESAAKTDRLALDLDQLLDNQKADAEATLIILGALQVADCERSPKLRAQRANKFRADFRKQVSDGVPARQVADQLVRDACPWMSR